MSAVAVRQALGRAARALGLRAEHTAAAVALPADSIFPTSDPILRPFYEKITGMEVVPAQSPRQSSDSETAAELELFRMHNSSLSPVYEGHMIKATVLEVGRRTVTLDTGLKPARVSRADIPPDCIIGSVVPQAERQQRRPGQVLVGDVVQVYLEDVGTPEGDFLVSGMQAAVQRRMAAVWNELDERMQRGELVKGRILNAVWSGYAVGVAGVVAFLPARQCSRPTARRIGQLQKFRILEVNRARPALVLADPNLVYPSPQPVSLPAFARRAPKTEEDAARRRELSRVAEELRSVLALRSGAGSGSGSGGNNISNSSSGAAQLRSPPRQQKQQQPQAGRAKRGAAAAAAGGSAKKS